MQVPTETKIDAPTEIEITYWKHINTLEDI